MRMEYWDMSRETARVRVSKRTNGVRVFHDRKMGTRIGGPATAVGGFSGGTRNCAWQSEGGSQPRDTRMVVMAGIVQRQNGG